jgi:hypothetical protein
MTSKRRPMKRPSAAPSAVSGGTHPVGLVLAAVGRVRSHGRSPLAWVILVALGLRVVGLTWGLPASDGWDNDGVAPRDFFPGLIESFTPGHYFTYPPAHLAILSFLVLPVALVLIGRAPSLAPHDVIGEAIHVPYMTLFAMTGRVVGAILSLGIIYAVAKIAEAIAGRRAGLCAGAVCAVNVGLTYYGHTTNLDVPSLFWATLALLALCLALTRREPARLRAFALFAAVSVATKDQAYAVFVLAVPCAIGLWIALDDWARHNVGPLARQSGWAIGIGLATILVCDGILVNPTGFAARIRYLTGPASQPYAYYSADAWGLCLVVFDSVKNFGEAYPWLLAPLAGAGLVCAGRVRDPARRAAAFVPLAAIASFTLFFNCVARRTEHRFLMPQMVLWAVYAGLGLDGWLTVARPRLVARLAIVATFAWALFRCADVDANLLLDPRYDAEKWLRAHVAPGDSLEVHGYNVYLPRLPPQAVVFRVGPEPLSRRNPLPGVVEVEDSLSDVAARDPRWIVVSEGWAGHVLSHARPLPGAHGRIFARTEIASAGDVDATSFLQGLFDGRLGYSTAHVSAWKSRVWPRLDIHGSLAPTVWIFERAGGRTTRADPATGGNPRAAGDPVQRGALLRGFCRSARARSSGPDRTAPTPPPEAWRRRAVRRGTREDSGGSLERAAQLVR